MDNKTLHHRGAALVQPSVLALAAIAAFAGAARAQPTHYPKPSELPNPYRLVEGWPTLPRV